MKMQIIFEHWFVCDTCKKEEIAGVASHWLLCCGKPARMTVKRQYLTQEECSHTWNSIKDHNNHIYESCTICGKAKK